MPIRKRTLGLLSLLILLVSCSQTLVQHVADQTPGSSPTEGRTPLASIQKLLRTGPTGAAHALIEALPADSVVPPSLRAAALLEGGRSDLLDDHLPQVPSGPFEERLVEAADRTVQGAKIHLFDRFGQPLGYLAEDSEVHWFEGFESLDLTAAELQQADGALGLRLTFDAGLTRRLGRTLEGVQASVVVLDAFDGSVLFAGSDRRTRQQQDAAAFREQLEPASIAKLITTTAALRVGYDVDEAIRDYRCTGMTELGGSPLYCTGIGGRLTGGLSQALATSCNVAFADIGREIGRDALIDEFRRYGFSKPRTEQDTRSEGSLFSEMPGARDLGDLSIGLNHAELTPLHAAVLARTWIDGQVVQPFVHLVADGPLGNSPRPATLHDPIRTDFIEPEQILDPDWLPLLHTALESVTSRHGTASLVAPRDFPVAMKTGTGQTEGQGFHTNYVGFAPTHSPTVAFSIRVRRGRTSLRTRRATKALTRQVLRVLRDYQDDYRQDPVILRNARAIGASSRAPHATQLTELGMKELGLTEPTTP